MIEYDWFIVGGVPGGSVPPAPGPAPKKPMDVELTEDLLEACRRFEACFDRARFLIERGWKK